MDIMFCNTIASQTLYLIIININTKFLVVYPLLNKSGREILKCLKYFVKNVKFKINNIRGDAESGFLTPQLKQFFKDENINYYFTNKQHTNRNRIVDRVIRTLRDMFDNIFGVEAKEEIINFETMSEMVNKYNLSPHHAFDYMFSPAEVQTHPEVEAVFIRDNMNRLE
jgi:transposase